MQEPSPPSSPTAFGPEHTPYDALGGEVSVRRLVDAFYGHMESDEAFARTRAMYPKETTASREKLFFFLCGWLGGPPLYIEKYGHPRLRGRHAPFAIGAAERGQWLACMGLAMDDCRITGPVRNFLEARFAHVADFMRNQ